MSKKFTLRDIAGDMQTAAQRSGQAHRTLGGGLQLNLYQVTTLDGVQWRLVLRRATVKPSEQEIATVRRDFGVPTWATLGCPSETVVSVSWLERATAQIEQQSLLETI